LYALHAVSKKKKKIKKERGFLGMTVQLKGAFSLFFFSSIKNVHEISALEFVINEPI